MKNQPIDMRMSWQQAARIYIAVLENGTEKGKQIARAELMKIARIADAAKICHELADESFVIAGRLRRSA